MVIPIVALPPCVSPSHLGQTCAGSPSTMTEGEVLASGRVIRRSDMLAAAD